MDDDQATRAFDRFHTTRPGGTGLGIPIAHAIITAHGGHLDYRDGTVHVELPLSRPRPTHCKFP
jgi:signal transduction histidine kinase